MELRQGTDWVVDDLAVGWPGVKPQTIKPGESVTNRYRIWIHKGEPAAKQVEKAYEEYRTAQRTAPAR